jgi:hypothetical protein
MVSATEASLYVPLIISLIGCKAAFPSGLFKIRDPKNNSFPALLILVSPISQHTRTKISAAFSSDSLNKLKT